jgi:long-chain acyl-CoA synthetase
MSEEMPAPIAALLRRAADAPASTAVVAGHEEWSNRQLATHVDRLAAGLAAHGVRTGDRVALHLRNTVDAVLATLACLRIGAAAVTLNTHLAASELHDLLDRTRPAGYLGDSAFGSLLASVPGELLPEPARFIASRPSTLTGPPAWPDLMAQAGPPADTPLDLDAPAVLLPTSGTTGQSKLVIWSYRTLAALPLSAAGRGIGPGAVLPLLTPVVHASGMYHLCAALIEGATVVLLPAFDAGQALDAMERHHATSVFGLPFMYAQLAREQAARPRTLSALTVATSAGDECPAEVEAAFEKEFGMPLRSFWAATEDVGMTTADVPAGPYTRVIPEATVQIVGSDGRPAAEGQVGELLTSSPTTSPGYWQADGRHTPLPDGVFRTGDLVRERGSRLLEFVGRVKDIIVRGAFNIYPSEVEGALRSHPAVIDAGVAGFPDPVLGQRVGALVVLAGGTDAARWADEITSWLPGRLAPEKIPEQLRVVASIPRNALTKIDRGAVQAALAAPRCPP